MVIYNNNNKGPLIFSICHMHMLYIIVHCTTVSDIRRCHRWEPWVDISFNSLDGACSSANYCELLQAFTRCQSTLFMALQASNLGQCSACSLSSHIFVSPPTSHRPCWYQFIQLGEQRLLGVSSLSKAIGQKPSSQDSNSQPSDHKSRTLTTRPLTHPSKAPSLNVFYSI